MIFSFTCIGGIGMKVNGYSQMGNGKRRQASLREKGGKFKFHLLPMHCSAEEYPDVYLEAVGIGEEIQSPFFVRRLSAVVY